MGKWLRPMSEAAEFRRVIRTGHKARQANVIVYCCVDSREVDSRETNRGVEARADSLRPAVPELTAAGGPATSGQPAITLGLIVNKAVGDAVRRNLVKRRLRSIMRTWAMRSFDIANQDAPIGEPHTPPGYSVVIRALPSSAEASYKNLESDVYRSLSKLG